MACYQYQMVEFNNYNDRQRGCSSSLSKRLKAKVIKRLYLDIDNRGFVEGDAEDLGCVVVLDKLRSLILIHNLHTDLRNRHVYSGALKYLNIVSQTYRHYHAKT